MKAFKYLIFFSTLSLLSCSNEDSKKMGIGGLIGLTFATSVYIWNNNSLNKEQKGVLLFFIIFPPIQWLGLVAVLIYNTNKINNSIEKKQERKTVEKEKSLNKQIKNLTDLKEKGILTEEEFSQKLSKIEEEKSNENLKLSKEYKQLKSLFDSGVLTKDEFDNKVKLIDFDKKTIEIASNNNKINYVKYETDKGIVELEPFINMTGTKAFMNGKQAPDGKYMLGWWEYFIVKDGIIIKS